MIQIRIIGNLFYRIIQIHNRMDTSVQDTFRTMKQSNSQMDICLDGGFHGYLSKCTYYSYPIENTSIFTNNNIYSLFREGPFEKKNLDTFTTLDSEYFCEISSSVYTISEKFLSP